jgi:hypothetical protein
MALFGKKNKNEKNTSCCGGSCDTENMAKAEKAKAEGASVKVLGSGCAKCNQLEAATKAALEQLGMDATIDHVTDFAQIATYGVMPTRQIWTFDIASHCNNNIHRGDIL